MEAVLASFLLLTAVSMSIWVFDASLRAGAENDRHHLATLLAQNRLEELRGYGLDDFTALGNYDKTTSTTPDGFQIATHVVARPLYAACSALESQYPDPVNVTFPTPAKRVLNNSTWQVEVVVTWSSQAADRVTLVSYIGDWRDRGAYSVQITPARLNAPLAPQGLANFTAQAVDAAGKPLPDLFFTWYTIDLEGKGTIAQTSRDGRQAQYQNNYMNQNGKYAVQKGLVKVQARAVYRGVEVNATVPVTNQ